MAVIASPRAEMHRRVGARTRFRGAGGWWVVGTFALSRLLAMLAGVRFDASWLDMAWQFADPEALRSQLLGTLYYAHTQPPGFNLLLGLVVRFSPFPVAVTFQVVYLVLGLVLGLAALDLCRSLGARRRAAICGAVLISCSPAALLYENYLFYTYPCAVGLTVAMAALARWVQRGQLVWLGVFVAATGSVALTRSLLHPVWLLAVLAVALLGRRPEGRDRWRAAAIAAVPLVLLGGVIVKNQVEFGEPATSSWLGMNLQRVTTEQLSDQQRQRLIDEGRLSPQAAVPAFKNYSAYDDTHAPCPADSSGTLVLGQEIKSTGFVNFNSRCFLPLFRQARHDALAAGLAYPGLVARGQLASWQLSLMPSSDYQYVVDNREHLGLYDDLFKIAPLLTVNLGTAVATPPNQTSLYTNPVPLSLTILAALILVTVVGVRSLRAWRRRGPDPFRVTTVAIALTTGWVLVVGNAFEIGENNRFRWMVEPMTVAVLVAMIDRAIVWRARRPADSGDVSEPSL